MLSRNARIIKFDNGSEIEDEAEEQDQAEDQDEDQDGQESVKN